MTIDFLTMGIAGFGWGAASDRFGTRSPQFLVLVLAFFCCCAAHSGPIFHMVSYAMICGIPAMTAASIYRVEGLSGLGGRLLLGVLADRLGAKPVLVGGLLVQAFAIGAYLVVNRLGEFYALSIVFGTAYGGVMPLYAVLARVFWPPHHGNAIRSGHNGIQPGHGGPWAGGIIFDTFNDYRWLYIGSLSVGFGAMAVALAFPPLPLRSRERLQAA
jgi:MFS family permease